jgi:hypothetical protein
VRDPQDIVDIDGLREAVSEAESRAKGPRRKFLMIWFRCCHVYGRLYRNDPGTAYAGRCPKCGASVQALIGPDGTSQRMFEAR